MSSLALLPAPGSTRSVVRRWYRNTPRGEQTARLEFVVAQIAPPGDVVFAAAPQHDFGDPRYYEWSGLEPEGYDDEGRIIPFDLVVGPPRPQHRSSAFDADPAMHAGLALVEEALLQMRHVATQRRRDVNAIDLFHPVLVVQAPLLLFVDETDIRPIEWIRYERNRLAVCDRTWIDVVTAASYQNVMARLGGVYAKLYGRLRCSPKVQPAAAVRPAVAARPDQQLWRPNYPASLESFRLSSTWRRR